MFCPKCGTQNPDGTRFCQACGRDGQTPGPMQPPYPAQPQYPNPQAGFQSGPGYSQGMPTRQVPPKKKHTGCLVVILLLLVIAAGAVWFIGSLSLFKPKDLGVNYQKEDFVQVLQKIGTQVDAEMPLDDFGEALNDAKAAGGKEITKNGKTYISVDNNVMVGMFGKNGKVKKLNPADYVWTFTDVQPKTFRISANEASAFFNETAPAFWWFKQSQIKVVGGNVITSSQLDIAGLLKFLYPDVAKQIPIPLPENANLYTEGKISVADNRITMKPEVFNIGPVALPEQFRTEKANTVVASFLDRMITMIPGLVINKIEEKGGEFDVDALIPQKVTVRPK